MFARAKVGVAQAGGTVTLTWEALAGTRYGMEWADRLDGAPWTPLAHFTATMPGPLSVQDVPATPPRFYRLRVLE